MAINIPIKKRQQPQPAMTAATQAVPEQKTQQPTAQMQQPVQQPVQQQTATPSAATTPQAPATVPVSDIKQQTAAPQTQAVSAPQPQAVPAPQQTAVQPQPQPDISKMNDAQKAEFYMQSYSKGSTDPRQISLQQVQDKYNSVPQTQYAEPPAKLDYEAILNKIAPVPETAEQERIRKRRAKANAYLAALGDGIASIANLVATTKYAPNAYDGSNSLSERARLRYEKNKEKIEALQKERRMAEYQMTKAKYDDDWKRAEYDNNLASRKRAEAMQEAQNLAQLYNLETSERNAQEQRDLTKAKWYKEEDRFNKTFREQQKARAAARASAARSSAGRGRSGRTGSPIFLGKGKYEIAIPSEAWYDDDYMIGMFDNMSSKMKGMAGRGVRNLYNTYKQRMSRVVGGGNTNSADSRDSIMYGNTASGGPGYLRDFPKSEKAMLARQFFNEIYADHADHYDKKKRTAAYGTYSPYDLNQTSKALSQYIYQYGTPM